MAAAAIVIVITNAPVAVTTHPHRVHAGRHRRIPAYWTVRPNDTLAQVSSKTGVSVARIEALNPNADPQALIVGERLKLQAHLPRAFGGRPASVKPLPPLFWTVRTGQSYGSIAVATGINILRLEQLNPHLAPGKVQPGDRIRLRSTSALEQAMALDRLREGRPGP